MLKTRLSSIALIYGIQLIEIHTNLSFFRFMYSTFHMKQRHNLLENNWLLYSLRCSLLTPHVLIVNQIHFQDQSLS
jgi:hypothetical protein